MFSPHTGADQVLRTDYVFFGSTGEFRAFKGSVYEGGIRMPFIVRWLGKIRAEAVSELPAAFYDVLRDLTVISGEAMTLLNLHWARSAISPRKGQDSAKVTG